MSSTRSKPPAPDDSRAHQRIKSSLVDELSSVLKTLQKNNVTRDEPIISDSSANAVCNVLEAVFLHGLKATYSSGGWSLFGSKTDAAHAHFWPFLQKFTHKGVVSQLDNLGQIKTDIGKCRAWVRLAINDGLIENYLDAMLADLGQIRNFYINHAFLRDLEKPEILKFYLKGLGEFMFELSYNSSMLNMWPTQTLFLSGLWAVQDAPQPTMAASVSDTSIAQLSPHQPPAAAPPAIQILSGDIPALEVSLTTARKRRTSLDPYDAPFHSRDPSREPSLTNQDQVRATSSKNRLHPQQSLLDFRPIAVTPPSQHLDGFMSKMSSSRTMPELTSSTSDSDVSRNDVSPRAADVRNDVGRVTISRKVDVSNDGSNSEEIQAIAGKVRRKRKSDVGAEDVDVAIDVASNLDDLDQELNLSTESDKLSCNKPPNDVQMASPIDEMTSSTNPLTSESTNVVIENKTSQNDFSSMTSQNELPVMTSLTHDYTSSTEISSPMERFLQDSMSSIEKESQRKKSLADELEESLEESSSESSHNHNPHSDPISFTLPHFYTVEPTKIEHDKSEFKFDSIQDFRQTDEPRESTSPLSSSLPTSASSKRRNSRRGSEHLIPDFSRLKGDKRTVMSESGALATSKSPQTEDSPISAVEKMRNAMSQRFVPENLENVTCGLEADSDDDSFKGNNLGSMSGWSSNFHEKTGADEGREAIYEGATRVVAGEVDTTVNRNDFESVHLMFSPILRNARLPDSADSGHPSHSSSHDEEDFEVIPRDQMNGQDQTKVTELLHLLGVLTSEHGLDSQNFQCRGCQKPIGIIYGKFRACRYDGYYYCLECHGDDEYYIPARIVHNWDFTKHKVCKENKCFLIQVQEEPILDVEKINPRLYEHSDEMNELQVLRRQCVFLKAYLFTCKQSVADELRRMIWPREHLYEAIHLYSLSDLLQAHSGQLAITLKKVVLFAEKHVYGCLLCSQKGFFCEICNSSNVIFPFQVDTTVQCPGCSAVFHRACKSDQQAPCPRCQRRLVRRLHAGSMLHTPDAVNLNFTPDFSHG